MSTPWDPAALKRLLDENNPDKLLELTGMTPEEAERSLQENTPDDAPRYAVSDAEATPPNAEIAELTKLVEEHDWEAFDKLLGITPEAIDEILSEKPWVEIAEESGPIGPVLEEEGEEPEEKRE